MLGDRFVVAQRPLGLQSGHHLDRAGRPIDPHHERLDGLERHQGRDRADGRGGDEPGDAGHRPREAA
jgi:hypothetical protein